MGKTIKADKIISESGIVQIVGELDAVSALEKSDLWKHSAQTYDNINYTKGRVSIGTIDTNSNLQVEGNIYVSSNLEVGEANLFVDTETSKVGIGTRTPLTTLHVEGNVYASSNVGIGTSTPEYTLDVHGTANVGALTVTSVAGDGSGLTNIPHTAVVGGEGVWAFNEDDTIYYIDGNVGIGKTNPGYTLDVNGDIHFSGGLYQNEALFVSSPWDIETNPDALSYTAGNVGIGVSNPSANLHVTGNAYVSSNLEVGQANLFVDTQTTRVGIGKSNPGYTLDVNGDLHFSGGLYQNEALFVSTPWEIETNPDALSYTAGNVGIGASNPSANLHVTGNTYVSSNLEVGEANLFVDTTTTRVGIGKTDPAEALDVVGTIQASGDVVGFSDRRLKSNIQRIEGALDKVCALSGYTFMMNDKPSTGLIAQEVLEVLPEAVHGSEETQYSLAYGNMIGLLVEAVKELRALK